MRSPARRGRALRALAVGIALSCAASACTTPNQKKREAVYGPTESILEVVAVLRRHVPDDTYRFPPATDFAGRNVYRASLMRIENLEVLHAEALRAGHMEAVMAFSKGRALERLRAYDLAAEHYRNAATRKGILKEEALRSAAFCEALSEAVAVGIDMIDPLAAAQSPAEDEEESTLGNATGSAVPQDPEQVISELDERLAALSRLLEHAEDVGPRHYAPVVREEIERADRARASYFVAMRYVLPQGSVRAVSELQRVISRHSPSKDRRRHVIALADFYALLAREYVAAHPPESLRFDPPQFQELVDAASQLYQSVADQDGSTEKIEAARRFEAFLAFTLQVDRDRFTPQ